MNYFCNDRGSVRCPCHLMESGGCYTCTMIREGVCRCDEAGGWRGSCPYTECVQQGGIIRQQAEDRMQSFPILRKISYGGGLLVVRLAVPEGVAEQCRRPGAYMMAEALGWRTPVSVLRVRRCSPTRSGWVEFLIKVSGPKTRALAEEEERWLAAGPYFGGLLRGVRLETLPPLVIARGTAAAPLVHLLDPGDSTLDEEETAACTGVSFYLDCEMLPEAFLEEYLQGRVFMRIHLRKEECLLKMKKLVEDTAGRGKPVLLLVSPYYVKRLTADLGTEALQYVTVPNSANLCCGMGICGACSHTDRDGVTVKLCKCTENMIK